MYAEHPIEPPYFAGVLHLWGQNKEGREQIHLPPVLFIYIVFYFFSVKSAGSHCTLAIALADQYASMCSGRSPVATIL